MFDDLGHDRSPAPREVNVVGLDEMLT